MIKVKINSYTSWSCKSYAVLKIFSGHSLHFNVSPLCIFLCLHRLDRVEKDESHSAQKWIFFLGVL